MEYVDDLNAKERAAVKYAFALLHSDAYFGRYFKILGDVEGPKAAYQQLEDEVERLTGRHRYSDYEWFRKARHRYCTRILRRR